MKIKRILLTMLLFTLMTVSVHAAEVVSMPDAYKNFPEYTDAGEYHEHVMFRNSYNNQDLFIYFYSNSPFEITSHITTSGQLYFSSNSAGATYMHYYTFNSSENAWKSSSTEKMTGSPSWGIDNFYTSSFDVTQGNTVFFSAQVPPTLEEVTAEAVTKAQTTVVGTMKILVLCGVGLIALLMVLSLFGKVFKIFRVQ